MIRQWKILEPHIPRARCNEESGGAPERYSKREIVNGMLYLKTNGCSWHDLPHDLPPSAIVYHYFNEWSEDGTLEQIMAILRKKLRQKYGKDPDPTVAIIDSKTVKNTDIPDVSGYDAGKLTKGVKRTLAVETLGLPLVVFVHGAGIQDRDGAKPVLKKLNRLFRRLRKVFADRAYQGSLVDWVKRYYSWVLEIVKRVGKGFVVEPKRWIIERTYGWLEKARRLGKNYEATTRNAEGMIYLTMIHLMTKRLAGDV